MKIVATATGSTLDHEIDPRFGRCEQFLLVDTDEMQATPLANAGASAGGGAGIQAAQLVADQGAAAVLTGNCGPNAHRTLTAAGIQVISGCSGTVREAVEQFKAGKLQAAGAPTVASKYGVSGA